MHDKKLLQLSDTLNTMRDGIYISDDQYIIIFMNLAMTKIVGNKIGKKCYEIIAKRDDICPKCRLTENESVGKNYQSLVVPIRNIDGHMFRLSVYENVTEVKEKYKYFGIYKDHYKRIFDHVDVGVFISTKEGKFIDTNPALLEMLGYKYKEEFLKLDLVRDIYLKPEERADFQKMIEAENKVVDYNVTWKRSDGKTISVLLTAHVRYDDVGRVTGYEGICVDQSQRLKMEKELRETHAFLNKTIQSSSNAIMATDMNGNIIIWNRGAEETFKYSAKEVVGKMHVVNLYHNNRAKEVMKMIRSEEYGGKGKLRAYPMTLMTKDNQPVEGNLSANIIYNEQMEEIASVGIFVDLTWHLDMERKLRTTQEQLLQSEKLAAMGRLTSQIAHEINNPLYGIMNTFELLKTEIKPDNKRRKLLDMALSETERLADMLRKMLSFSRPDQEERSMININTILDEILLLNKKRFSERSIKIVSNIKKSLNSLNASKNQLRQVFLNMISNAVDAMPDGGILTVNTESTVEHVYIYISDTGIGIKEEHIGLVFETFFTTKTDSVKGVGLGLSVCYGFINDHGGDIKVESKIGEGATFIIILPINL